MTPAGVWHYYGGRAGMEPRICELREDFGLRKIPTASFAANALYLEIIRLAYNLVPAFPRNCLKESWQNLTLQKLRYKLFLLPGELTRPVLRLQESSFLRDLARDVLKRVHRLKPLQSFESFIFRAGFRFMGSSSFRFPRGIVPAWTAELARSATRTVRKNQNS